MIRTFVAITPSAEILARIDSLQEELRAAGADVRWLSSTSMHLTLQFLGDVPEGEIAGISRALTEAFREQLPIEIECRGLGVFPNLKKPRVLWVGLHGEDLSSLVERTEIALAPLGFPPAEREFRPHVTLGRVRSMHGFEPVGALVRATEDRCFGSCRIDHAVLFKSDLQPQGSVYTALATLPFGGG